MPGSLDSFSANIEMLAVAAWLAQQQAMQETIAQYMQTEDRARGRLHVRAVMQQLLDQEVARVARCGLYGSTYERLLRHRLAHVEIDLVKGALLGEHGLGFRKDHQPSLSPSQQEEARRSETAVFLEAIRQNPRLLAKLCQQRQNWREHVEQGASILKALFSAPAPLVMRTQQCAGFVAEFLQRSLDAIAWPEIAVFVSALPPVPLDAQTMPDADAEARLTFLEAQLWQSFLSLSEHSQDAAFTDHLHHVCRNLALHCHLVYEDLRTLEYEQRLFAFQQSQEKP